MKVKSELGSYFFKMLNKHFRITNESYEIFNKNIVILNNNFQPNVTRSIMINKGHLNKIKK